MTSLCRKVMWKTLTNCVLLRQLLIDEQEQLILSWLILGALRL